MKIRIKGNSIRYRLSKTDLYQLKTSGLIEEKTEFGDAVFYYALKAETDINEISATLKDNRITIYMPAVWAIDWHDVRVGFDHYYETGNGKSLYLLVEKDFKCLETTAEDQSDYFENPKLVC